MEIRRMISADVSRVAKMEAECFADPYSYESIDAILCSEGAMCFSALTDGGELIAYFIGRLIAPEGELYRIAVKESHRGRGVGYRLMDYAVKTSRGKGLEALFLEVRESNLAALALYRAYGFRKIGVRRDYYKSPKEDALVMALVSKSDMIN